MRILAALLALIVGATSTMIAPAAAEGGGPDTDTKIAELLQEARRFIDQGNPTAAIPKCDAVINAYRSHYGSRKQRILCTRTSAESLAVLLKAAADQTNAIAMSSTWSDAYLVKAYALQEVHRTEEAEATLQLALRLSPRNSQYLSEIGAVYALRKNWPKAEQAYRDAEDNAPLAPDLSRADELARARRGLGYVLVERGKLDEAEQKYHQCLVADPNDDKARAELAYVSELKAKRRKP